VVFPSLKRWSRALSSRTTPPLLPFVSVHRRRATVFEPCLFPPPFPSLKCLRLIPGRPLRLVWTPFSAALAKARQITHALLFLFFSPDRILRCYFDIRQAGLSFPLPAHLTTSHGGFFPSPPDLQNSFGDLVPNICRSHRESPTPRPPPPIDRNIY